MNPITDEQIVQGLKNGNEAVLSYLYKEYGPKVLGIVIQNSGNEEDGYDLLQATILKVWQNVKEGKYNEQGRFRQYFFGVAYKDWLYELRTRKNKKTTSIDDDDNHWQIADDNDDGIFQAIVKENSLIALHEALKAIGASCKDILTRFHLDKLSSKQIAEEMNSTDGYIRKRLFDCRQNLKTMAAKLVSENQTF